MISALRFERSGPRGARAQRAPLPLWSSAYILRRACEIGRVRTPSAERLAHFQPGLLRKLADRVPTLVVRIREDLGDGQNAARSQAAADPRSAATRSGISPSTVTSRARSKARMGSAPPPRAACSVLTRVLPCSCIRSRSRDNIPSCRSTASTLPCSPTRSATGRVEPTRAAAGIEDVHAGGDPGAVEEQAGAGDFLHGAVFQHPDERGRAGKCRAPGEGAPAQDDPHCQHNCRGDQTRIGHKCPRSSPFPAAPRLAATAAGSQDVTAAAGKHTRRNQGFPVIGRDPPVEGRFRRDAAFRD